jgi:ABC-type lipoprotein export system ATPase subunit
VARALVNTPAIVWADEPTGALDSAAASEIMDLLIELNQTQRLTIVLVTHDQGVGNMCNRIVRMRDGEIVGEDIPDRGISGRVARAGEGVLSGTH